MAASFKLHDKFGAFNRAARFARLMAHYTTKDYFMLLRST
jgi:hypothetical protein